MSAPKRPPGMLPAVQAPIRVGRFNIDPLAALPFGDPLFSLANGGNGAAVGCPKGFHPNKSSYWRSDGGAGAEFVDEGSICVKDRRRNALNPRALTRAVGRVKSAKTANKILSRITIRGPSCPKKK